MRRYRKPTFTRTAPVDLRHEIAEQCEVVIEALAESFAIVPLDRFPRFSLGSWAFFELMIRSFADLLKVSLALAAMEEHIASLVEEYEAGLGKQLDEYSDWR